MRDNAIPKAAPFNQPWTGPGSPPETFYPLSKPTPESERLRMIRHANEDRALAKRLGI